MYVILVYDVNQKRTGKMLKLCRKYLHWIQNSVLEGEITPSKLSELRQEASLIMKEDDSLIIFKSPDGKWLKKEVTGKEKSPLDSII
ncbi:MAG: CRISPR-associated endonuclease Cas2 [Balneolales bacterium]